MFQRSGDFKYDLEIISENKINKWEKCIEPYLGSALSSIRALSISRTTEEEETIGWPYFTAQETEAH